MPLRQHKSIYLLPNLLTTASLFAGFYAVIAIMKGLIEPAVIAIYIALIADGLDGRVARMTHTQSAFGAEYDSLSDLVSFGVAPALLIYFCYLQELGKFGWCVAFIYTAATALRLARFNTQTSEEDKAYFKGLPCPLPAALLVSTVWLLHETNWHNTWITIFMVGLILVLSGLMVSTVRYYSFKTLKTREQVPFIFSLLIILLLVGIALAPALVLFGISFTYALSGPVVTLSLFRRRCRQQRNKRKIG